MEKSEVIKKLDCFIDIDEVERLSALKSYCAGDVLYYEGDIINKHYFLVSGSVKAYKVARDREIFLYSLSGVDCINDISEICLSTVEVMSDCTILELPSIVKLTDSFNCSHAFKRVELLNKCIDINLVHDALARVSFFLLHELKLFNSLKRKDVASMLNLTGETLSRVLSRLLKSKAVVYSENELKILDEAMLTSTFA